jgi:hypothetical protein
MAYFGNRRTSGDAQWGLTGDEVLNQRATVFGPFPEDGWATAVGVWGGRNTASNPRVVLAIWNSDGSDVTARRGYTDSFFPSALMADHVSGASYESSLAHMNLDYSPSDDSCKMNAGEYYGVGFNATENPFAHGMSDTARALHRRTVTSQPPTTPFNPSISDTELVMSVWIVYTPNSRPSTPANPSPAGTITDPTPTFTAEYNDSQRALGDKMKSYRIQLRRVGTSTLLWNQQYNATSAEQAADAMSRAYGGSALSTGVEYEWRVRMADQFDTASEYCAWRSLTIGTGGVGAGLGGVVDTPSGSTPNGKQDAINGFTFQGYWSHTESLAMDKVTIELRQNGTVSQRKEFDIPNVASSGGLGTFFDVTFAEFGLNDLSYGQSYAWRLKGMDTNGVYSPYSDSVSFTTNTIPTQPTGLSPAQSTSVSAAPNLTMTMTDEDDDPAVLGGLLEATCYIKSTPVIPNDTFDVNIAGWTASNTGDTAGATTAWSWDNADVGGGWGTDGHMKAVISASTAAASASVYHSDLTAVWMPCVEGFTYTASVETRTTTTNIRPQIMIKWYNSSKTLLSTSTEDDWVMSTGVTNTNSLSAVAPAGATFWRVGVFLRTKTANVLGTAYFDNIEAGESSVRFVRDMSYDVTTGKWEYQTLAGTDDVQTITKTGTVTGGTWGFTFNGAVASLIPYNVTSAALQTTLTALSTIGTDNVLVEDVANGWKITFRGELGGTYQNVASVSSALTGGGTIGITHTTDGVFSDIGQEGKYWWTAFGTDTVNTGDISSQAAFYFVSGPVVVITSHDDSDILPNSRPEFIWTASNQLKYRVVIYATGTTTQVYNSGLITSGIQSHEVPAGFLFNNTSYDVQISVTNTSGIVGSNSPITVTLVYNAPPELAFTATEMYVGHDQEPSSILCAWDLSEQPPTLFEEYIIGRRETGQDIEDEIILRRISNINQGTFVDHYPASGVSYTYSLRQAVLKAEDDAEAVESGVTESDATVSFNNIIINSALAGGSLRALLRFNTDRSADHQRDQTVLNTWGNSKPIILQNPTNYQIIKGTFTIVTDLITDALQYMEAVRELWHEGETCCFRDERGRKVFGLLSRFSESDQLFYQYAVDIEFTETDFTEGQR